MSQMPLHPDPACCNQRPLKSSLPGPGDGPGGSGRADRHLLSPAQAESDGAGKLTRTTASLRDSPSPRNLPKFPRPGPGQSQDS